MYITKKEMLIIEYLFLSGRQDSNLRPPGPKPGALPDCATPRFSIASAKVHIFFDTSKLSDSFYQNNGHKDNFGKPQHP